MGDLTIYDQLQLKNAKKNFFVDFGHFLVKIRLFWPKNGPSENRDVRIVRPPKHPLYTSNLCLKMLKGWFKHCRGCRRAPYHSITH